MDWGADLCQLFEDGTCAQERFQRFFHTLAVCRWHLRAHRLLQPRQLLDDQRELLNTAHACPDAIDFRPLPTLPITDARLRAPVAPSTPRPASNKGKAAGKGTAAGALAITEPP